MSLRIEHYRVGLGVVFYAGAQRDETLDLGGARSPREVQVNSASLEINDRGLLKEQSWTGTTLTRPRCDAGSPEAHRQAADFATSYLLSDLSLLLLSLLFRSLSWLSER